MCSFTLEPCWHHKTAIDTDILFYLRRECKFNWLHVTYIGKPQYPPGNLSTLSILAASAAHNIETLTKHSLETTWTIKCNFFTEIIFIISKVRPEIYNEKKIKWAESPIATNARYFRPRLFYFHPLPTVFIYVSVLLLDVVSLTFPVETLTNGLVFVITPFYWRYYWFQQLKSAILVWRCRTMMKNRTICMDTELMNLRRLIFMIGQRSVWWDWKGLVICSSSELSLYPIPHSLLHFKRITIIEFQMFQEWQDVNSQSGLPEDVSQWDTFRREHSQSH